MPLGPLRGADAVVASVQHDGGHRDVRSFPQPFLGGLQVRIPGGEAEPMPIRMYDHVDEVWILEGQRRPFVRGVGESPAGRPELPEELAKLPTIPSEPGPA